MSGRFQFTIARPIYFKTPGRRFSVKLINYNKVITEEYHLLGYDAV
jgi:hypothetical protein